MSTLYDDLAARCCNVSRDFIKKAVHEYSYGGGDPWVNHILKTEMEAIEHELPRETR
jgi:hypothetical protein